MKSIAQSTSAFLDTAPILPTMLRVVTAIRARWMFVLSNLEGACPMPPQWTGRHAMMATFLLMETFARPVSALELTTLQVLPL